MKKNLWRNTRWLNEPIGNGVATLDLGAGGFRRGPGVVTMDVLPLPNTDVVHDAEVTPWPFRDGQFDYVIASNVVEHIRELIPFMQELRRVVRPGGIVRGVMPHFSNPCTYADPTHRRACSVHLLDFFCRKSSTPPDLAWARRLAGCDIGVGDQFRMNLFETTRRSLYFREAVWWTLAPLWGNLFQDFYEVYGSRLIPAWDIYFELKAL